MTNEAESDWCFTINNFTEADVEMLGQWAKDCKILVCSKEVGDSGTPHIQGRVKFRRNYRLTGLKKLHSRANWSKTKATADSIYCIKEGSDVLHNVDNRRQGARNELAVACQAMKDGASMHSLCMNHTEVMVKFGVGMQRVMKRLRSEPDKVYFGPYRWRHITDWSVTHVICGTAGMGKTQFARAHFEKPYIVSHIDMVKDFDPDVYDGIVFDDLSVAHLPRQTNINILDMEQGRDIHCRHTNGWIPAGTRKIFTCNYGHVPLIAGWENDLAIARRVKVQYID